MKESKSVVKKNRLILAIILAHVVLIAGFLYKERLKSRSKEIPYTIESIQNEISQSAPVADLSDLAADPNINDGVFTSITNEFSFVIPDGWEVTKYSNYTNAKSDSSEYYNEYIFLTDGEKNLTFSNFDGPSYNCLFEKKEDTLYPPHIGFYEEYSRISTEFHDELIVGRVQGKNIQIISFCLQDNYLESEIYVSRVIGDTSVIGEVSKDAGDGEIEELIEIVESIERIK